MSSSTKPPPVVNVVQQTRKFNFDMDFKVEDDRMRSERRQQDTELVPDSFAHPAAPSFSEEDLQQACREALEQGIQRGREESAQAVETVLASMTGQFVAQTAALLEAEQSRTALAQEIALGTTIAAIKKIWPDILRQLGLPLIESTLRQSMDYNPEEPRLVVRVHDTLLDAVVKNLPQIQLQQAFAGKVIVIADAAVIAGDCKIEWADGGLERISRTLSQQLDAAWERLLSTLHSSQNIDPERN